MAVPGSPTAVIAVAGDSSATVSWTAPAYSGTIGLYTAISAPDGAACTTAGATSCTVTGLTNGTGYTFTVSAANSMGTGLPSAPSAAVTPATVPGAPTAVSALRGNAAVLVSWTAPLATGGSAISGYTVISSPGSLTCTAPATATSCTVSGLTNGTGYTFAVTAANSVGTGPGSSSQAVTPTTVPGPPTRVTATRGNASVSVSWAAPSLTGSSSITGYTVTASPGGNTCTTAGATSCTVSGLTNGTSYTFIVTAANTAGTGLPSDPSPGAEPASEQAALGANVGLACAAALEQWRGPAAQGAITGGPARRSALSVRWAITVL
jgi:hypothetical protein